MAAAAALPSERKDFNELVHAAEGAYEQGRYEEASASWGEMLRGGCSDPALYYSLGCAAYRAGRPGLAAWAFEQCLLLQPSHSEAKANLSYLREQGSGESDAGGADAFLRWLHGLVRPGTADAMLCASLWGIPLGWTLLRRNCRRAGVRTLAAAAAALVLAGALSAALHYHADWAPRAMLIEETPLRSGPREMSPAPLTLPAGSLLRLEEKRGEWQMVSLADGKAGWLPAASLRRLGRGAGDGAL
jgi:hypothetical protein